ncbi:MAG: M81 family metallopeptidase, partial [Bacteroidota bacterium]
MAKQLLNSISIAVLIGLFISCQSPDYSQEKSKIAVIKYQHETCTFCPGGDTEIDDWSVTEAEDVLKSGSYIRGFVHTANMYDGIELVGIKSPNNVFGGSSRSWNSKESFDHFMNMILEDLKSKMPVQGVYLSLHGALAVKDVPRPEAEIARRVRDLVGDDVPIAGSFDLHGNEDKEFLKWADAAFVTKRYPHYDAFIQGGRSATFLYRAMNDEYQATTATRKPPIITATVLQWTGESSSMKIMERARRWEARQKDTY